MTNYNHVSLKAEWLTAPATCQLIAAFNKAEIPLRFVGGCVRDSLIGRPVSDIDAATPAAPDRVMELLQQAEIKAIPTGMAHGTVTAIINRQHFEITTLREDIACDGRHASVRYTDQWELDARRRDFTLNALYCDASGKVYDYTGGISDAKTGRIRFIGDAVARIREDGLRILRFFRFYATHGKGEPDAQALNACRYAAAMLTGLSGERIQQEMLKLLAAHDPQPAVRYMVSYRILRRISPVDALPNAIFARLIAIDHPLQRDPLLRLSLLLRRGDIDRLALPLPGWQKRREQRISALTQRWKLSNKQQQQLRELCQELVVWPHEPKWLEKNAVMLKLPLVRLQQLGMLSHAEKRLAQPALRDALTYKEPLPTFPLSGRDVMAEGVPPGPEVGHILQYLEQRWLTENLQGDHAYWLEQLKRQKNNR